jgi:hypothetical protein
VPNIEIWKFYGAVPPESNGTAGVGISRLYALFDATETNLV